MAMNWDKASISNRAKNFCRAYKINSKRNLCYALLTGDKNIHSTRHLGKKTFRELLSFCGLETFLGYKAAKNGRIQKCVCVRKAT